MTKRLTHLILLLGCTNLVHGQIVVKQFFTKNDEPTVASKSFYYQVGEKVLMDRGEKIKWIDTVFIDTVKTFYSETNKIRSREVYRDGYREGPYSFYHENGRLQEKGNYKEGKKIGYVIRWSDEGALKQTLQYNSRESWERETFKIINYWNAGQQIVKEGFGYCKCDFKDDGLLEEGKVDSGLRDSVWRISAGDSIVSAEHYRMGKFIKGESTYKNERKKYEKIFEEALFPGGMSGMYKFLQQNQRYPVDARRAGKQGKVFIKFSIDTQGNISNVRIIKGAFKDLDKEALRLVHLSPAWEPARVRGIPVKSDFVLPINFKLED